MFQGHNIDHNMEVMNDNCIYWVPCSLNTKSC